MNTSKVFELALEYLVIAQEGAPDEEADSIENVMTALRAMRDKPGLTTLIDTAMTEA